MVEGSEALWGELVKAASYAVIAEPVRRELDRFAREMIYLERLLTIEGRSREWDDAAQTAQSVWELAQRGAWDQAGERVRDVEQALAALGPTAKSLTITYAGHAHMDMNWLWDWPETVDMVLSTLSTVDRLMDDFEEFHFSQSQTAIYDIVRRFDPELFERIHQRVVSGRWEITANQWVEGDKNVASGESIVRHLLYSKAFFAKHWQIPFDAVTIAFEPDTFGHPRGLPTIYRDAGIRWLYFCRGGPGHFAFRWRAPDESEIVAWSDFLEWYNGAITGDEVSQALNFYEETRIPHFLKLYGVGDHGGGPTRRDLQRFREMKDWPLFPTLKLGTLADHFQSLESHQQRLPVVTDELNHVFMGCYTAKSEVKTLNATNEGELRQAEGLAAMAVLLRQPLPSEAQATLRRVWELTLFSQFHDILSGSGVPATYEYALGQGQDVKAYARTVARRVMEELARSIDTRGGDAVPVVVFNALPWDRHQTVTVPVYERFEPNTPLGLRDHEGQAVAVQYVYDTYLGHRRAQLTFSASVPGLGYAVYYAYARSGAVSVAPSGLAVETVGDGHPAMRMVGDRIGELGWPSRVRDWPRSGLPREFGLFRYQARTTYDQGYRIVTAAGAVTAASGQSGVTVRTREGKSWERVGELQWFWEAPHAMSAWNVGPLMDAGAIGQTQWEVAEIGPVRAVLRARARWQSSTITADIVVDAEQPGVRIDLDIDWREWGSPEKGVPGLKIRFPGPPRASVRSGQTVGWIERAVPCQDVPAHGWTALAAADGCAVVYHPTRYAVSVDGDGVIAVTVLRASYEPDAYAEVGRHRVSFVYRWDEAERPDQWTRRAIEELTPLAAHVTEVHAGTLGSRGGTVRLCSDVGAATAVKPAEDGAGVIVRLLQAQTEPAEVVVDTSASQVTSQSVLERERPLPVTKKDGAIAVEIAPQGIVTLRLTR